MGICDHTLRGCILLDINMPQMSGIELQRWLVDNGIDLPIIFLTGSGDIPLSSQAFRTGALDFIEKPFDIDKLLERIHEALAREAGQWHGRVRRDLLRQRYARLTPRREGDFKMGFRRVFLQGDCPCRRHQQPDHRRASREHGGKVGSGIIGRASPRRLGTGCGIGHLTSSRLRCRIKLLATPSPRLNHCLKHLQMMAYVFLRIADIPHPQHNALII